MIPVLRETAMLYEKGVPSELQKALENVARYGNPFGESSRKRINWIKEAGVPLKILQKDKKPVNVLLIPECFCAYHQRAKNIIISLAKILHKLNVDFGIIGPDEKCIGDSKRLAGEFGLFEMLIEHNAKQLLILMPIMPLLMNIQNLAIGIKCYIIRNIFLKDWLI